MNCVRRATPIYSDEWLFCFLLVLQIDMNLISTYKGDVMSGPSMLKRSSIFIIFLLFALDLRASEQPFVISGFDDVLRQAENTGLIKSALKILEEDRTFTGMPELYKALTHEEPSPRFVIVSAISNWFGNRIERFLTSAQFPSNKRYLRNWLTEWSIEKFKIEKIREVLQEKPNRKFIVIFDNSEAS